MNAEVLLGRCRLGRGAIGLRVEERGDAVWHITWSFPLDEKRARREGYERRVINGTIGVDSEVVCCARCEAKSIVKCGSCGKVTCWAGGPTSKCLWCGVEAMVEGEIRSMEVGGDV